MISLLSHRMYSRYTRCTNKKKIRGVRLGVQEHSYLLNPNRTFFRLLAPTLSLATSTPSSRTTRTHTVPRFAHGKAALLPHPCLFDDDNAVGALSRRLSPRALTETLSPEALMEDERRRKRALVFAN